MKTILLSSLLGLLLFGSSCGTLQKEHIIEKNWSHSEGYNIGNSLIFHKKVQFRNDTIYKKGKILAIVLQSKIRFVSNDNLLIISDPSGKRIGHYISH